MTIKKRTLYIWIPIIVVTLIASFVAYNSYTEKRNKELQMQDCMESYDREVDREYRRLVDRMDSDAKTVMDYEYSSSFRRKEIRRINELFKGRFFFWYYKNLCGDFGKKALRCRVGEGTGKGWERYVLCHPKDGCRVYSTTWYVKTTAWYIKTTSWYDKTTSAF